METLRKATWRNSDHVRYVRGKLGEKIETRVSSNAWNVTHHIRVKAKRKLHFSWKKFLR